MEGIEASETAGCRMGGMIAKRFNDERCDILATLSRDSIVHDIVSVDNPLCVVRLRSGDL